MFKKNNFSQFVVSSFILFIFVCLWTTSCVSTRVAVDESVLEHQRRIASLEGRVLDYERRIAEFESVFRGANERLESIRGRAETIPDRVDRIDFLFYQYEQEVQRIISEGNSIRGANTQTEYNDNDLRNIGNSFLD